MGEVDEEVEKKIEDSEAEQPETKKESLKDRARKNLSLFIGKLSNVDEVLNNFLQPIIEVPHSILNKRKTSLTEKSEDGSSINAYDSSVEEVSADNVKIHDSQANRAEITTT